MLVVNAFLTITNSVIAAASTFLSFCDKYWNVTKIFSMTINAAGDDMPAGYFFHFFARARPFGILFAMKMYLFTNLVAVFAGIFLVHDFPIWRQIPCIILYSLYRGDCH